MAGYLEEKRETDGNVLTWQTPNRQRFWGLAAAIPPALIITHGLYGAPRPNIPEIVFGAVLLFGAFLVATWTVRFRLNLKTASYEHVKGFLPILLGEKGSARDAFQAVAVRAETMVDAARHENDPDAQDFTQYRVFMVWKKAGREAMLLDTLPANYAESTKPLNFLAKALARAEEIANPLKIDVLDQATIRAVVAIAEPAESQGQTPEEATQATPAAPAENPNPRPNSP